MEYPYRQLEIDEWLELYFYAKPEEVVAYVDYPSNEDNPPGPGPWIRRDRPNIQIAQ